MAASAATLLSVAQFLLRHDYNTVAQLCADIAEDGTESIPTEAQLSSNTKLAAALLDASGAVESALVASGRATIAQLAALAGVALGNLYRVIGRLAMCYLWDRRPDRSPVPKPSFYDEAIWTTKAIQYGDFLLVY